MRFFVYGVVQGVGFRPTVYNLAKGMGLRGYVRNNGSNVEISVDRNGEEFIRRLREELPPLSEIERIDLSDEDVDYGLYPEFVILQSTAGTRASRIPADTAICDNCLRELFTEGDRRHLYPFINCTDCGARYSLIQDLPYDREKTSMGAFALCEDCRNDYGEPSDRRFHAQTISCPKCGPRYTLYDGSKEVVESTDASQFSLFAEMINSGKVGVMKSWGGMHIISRLDAVPRLRDLYRREAKPFAVMFRDLDAAEEHAELTDRERELLLSPQRPIVLLRKKDAFGTLEDVSPGLGNVGVMLPYTAAHHLLFHHLEVPGIVATSANVPGEPMITENEEAFSLDLDCYLLHDRQIVQRCDDSLLKVHGDSTFFIRRSRGLVPMPIEVGYEGKVLSVGAERNVTASVSKARRLYVSQYIGNTTHYPTLQYLKDASRHLMNLLGIEKPDIIVQDLHPRYATRRIARAFAEEFGIEILSVQHHWAHAVSLALDNGIFEPFEPVVSLSLDGAGYGPDGVVWGGEILLSSAEKYERIGSLEELPLLGGDMAVREPKRMVLAVAELLGRECRFYKDSEKDVFRKMLGNSIRTTSSGRVLDAVSCQLGISERRTYDGEPAMKLERYLELGEKTGEMEGYETSVVSQGGRKVVRTLPLFETLLETGFESEKEKAIASYSFVKTLMTEMANLACDRALEEGIEYVGITGGVSYSLPLVNVVEGVVGDRGLELLLHKSIPNGDGGISVGQNVIGGFSID